MLRIQAKDFDICEITKLMIGYDNIKVHISNQEIFINGQISDELLSKICNMATICNIQNYEKKEKNIATMEVKRGQVYYCDFGTPYHHEQGFVRCAIVVQNDIGNSYNSTTIVVPCTSKEKALTPVHMEFEFSDKNMIDYSENVIKTKKGFLLAEQIRVVDKLRLLKYIGTMTPEFMNRVQEFINNSMDDKFILKEETKEV